MTTPTVNVAPLPARVERLVAWLVGRAAFWALLVGVGFSWPVIWSLRTPLPPPPPALSTLPAFELTDQAGQPFGSRDLAGRVWIASFVFTRCPDACPALVRVLARIQGRARNLEPAFHLVTFTVDPEHDTPAVLAAYARGARASPRMWTFLTGRTEAVRQAVVEGLHVSMGAAPGAAPADVSHGTSLVLVDGRGRVRGIYDPEAPDVVDRVVRDAGLLINREAGGRT
jgi:protein SCO1/2